MPWTRRTECWTDPFSFFRTVHQPKVEEVSTPSPASFTDEAIQIASASPAPESASLDPSASPAVEATSPPYSPQPFASSDDVQIEEMEGQQDETMPEADVEPVASVVVEEQQELEETAESALARQSQSHVVRNALSAISEQAQKEREVVLGDPVEMHELEKDEQAKEDEPGESRPLAFFCQHALTSNLPFCSPNGSSRLHRLRERRRGECRRSGHRRLVPALLPTIVARGQRYSSPSTPRGHPRSFLVSDGRRRGTEATSSSFTVPLAR